MWQELIREYILKPEYFWEKNKRQIEKFQKRKSVLQSKTNWPDKELISNICDAAERRVYKNCKTFYMPSFGSSGSHLLQHIIATLTNGIGLGEIYLPARMISEIGNLEDRQRKILMEAYHLSHCPDTTRILSTACLINTAHIPNLYGFQENTNNFNSILILRNPVDIVISRTFRKNEYRTYTNNETMSDMDYLNQNIKKTKEFFNKAAKYDFDQTIKYEEFITLDPLALSKIGELASCSLLGKSLIPIAIKTSLSSGGKTNKYEGEKTTIPEEYITHAEHELAEIKKTLQYT